MMEGPSIVGIGEALFDVFPGGQRLGGAPLNVAVHAHQLLGRGDGEGVVVSRVGQDRFGRALVEELKQRGLNTAYIQSDPDRPTGRVFIESDQAGQPSYRILENVAWDWLQYDFDLEDLAMACQAVCFGSVAQRSGQSRNTIYRFLDTASQAVRLFDVNLRPPWMESGWIRRGCEMATIVKLNEAELPQVMRLVGLPGQAGDDDGASVEQAEALRKRYKLAMVVLTRGERGTVLLGKDGQPVTGQTPRYEAASDADAVGAGDACSAGVLVGQTLGLGPERTVELANHMGAYVASRAGATPELPEGILGMISDL